METVTENTYDNIFPFFWQHGESEERIREIMSAIYECGCGSVCIESRPHPDFCGEKWWRDMNVILDEARKRKMKVWILDDSHFPSGFSNGALKEKPVELRRQSLVRSVVKIPSNRIIKLREKVLAHPVKQRFHGHDKFFAALSILSNREKFDDDRLLGVYAIKQSGNLSDIIDITKEAKSDKGFKVPKGEWNVFMLHLSRNFGAHRQYINMMDKESCRVFIDTVYETHFKHYGAYFGNTIEGFFSDEPEIGNGLLYKKYNTLGTEQDLPWSRDLESILKEELGSNFPRALALLWENSCNADETAEIRHLYMDHVTKLVRDAFSYQIGDWCREHGVKYIGHVIEDNNQHARTGSSLGHYFRGLEGQDMAGIDDIGGQVLPQQEDHYTTKGILGGRDGEFYHYTLAKLAASAAAIEPAKHGNSMCEIFGNYGWTEGVRLEKYLADHFMVRGINHFVPHAFSGKQFPDIDCPPHFYADGNDAQFRHFGKLIRYMGRISNLISGGKPIAKVAILYHGESEWSGNCMFMQKPAHILADKQIDYLFVHQDIFAEPEKFKASFNGNLKINGLDFGTLVIPYSQYLRTQTIQSIGKLIENGYPVMFLDKLPDGVCDQGLFAEKHERMDKNRKKLLDKIKNAEVVSLHALPSKMDELGIREIQIIPAARLVRYLHYKRNNGQDIFYFVNEADTVWKGKIQIAGNYNLTSYDAWDDRYEIIDTEFENGMTVIDVVLEPLKSFILLTDVLDDTIKKPMLSKIGLSATMLNDWNRSICKSLDYPNFTEQKKISLPDKLEKEKPTFSGFVKYETTILSAANKRTVLEISDAAEGVELFVNSKSAGIQIVPTYRYDITNLIHDGENKITIEVATTLARQALLAKLLYEKPNANNARSGITGTVTLWQS